MNTHSHQADARMEIMTAYAAMAGAGNDILRQIMSSVNDGCRVEILQQCGLLTETMQ